MDDELPCLVIIDDSKEFLDFICKDLDKYFVHYCINYNREVSLDQLLSVIQTKKPDHLLLDLNLGSSDASHEILEQATIKGIIPPNCKVWIISQGGHDKEASILGTFLKINANTQNKLLRKPIDSQQIYAELLDECIYNIQSPLDNLFPLPFRVLSCKGRIVYSNELWLNENYPRPSDSAIWLNKGDIPVAESYTGSFFSPDKTSFTLHSFLIEQNNESFLGQVVEQHPLNSFHTELLKNLDHIFKTMCQAGFTRGRYYSLRPLARHHDSEHYEMVAELLHISYTPPIELKQPYRFLVKGEFKRRLDSYSYDEVMTKDKLSKKLHYCIRTSKEDTEVNDPTINKLNQSLNINTLDSWLEIPVWIRDDYTQTEDIPTHRIAGLLIFDRTGDETQTGIDREITTENITPLESLLRSLLCLLNTALKQERTNKLKRYEGEMRQFDSELLLAKNTRDRHQKVLSALCKESGAKSGIMVIHGDDPDSLEIVATDGDNLPSGINKLRLPLSANYHPIVKAFNSRHKIICHDFQNGQLIGKLINGISSYSDVYWSSLNPNECELFSNWVSHDIKSLIAIPVAVSSERIIGGITLQFDQSLIITRRKEIQINAILQRARWVIQQALHEKEESYWQQTLGHDLKSDLYTIEQYMRELEKKNPELLTTPEWTQSKRYLLDSTDLAENWLDWHRLGAANSLGQFSPKNSILSYLNFNQLRIQNDQIKFNWHTKQDKPEWEQLLSGDEAIYGRVIRTLIDNAFKFGRVSIKEGEEVEISITATIEGAQMIIEIINPGCMTAEEYELRFKAGVIPAERKADGAHVGLNVAKRWVCHFHGDLLIENEKNNKVIARLSWPIIGRNEESHEFIE